MVADRRGNHECAKLIREYLENNDVEYYARSVDDIVEFITGGETQNKKKKKKRKNPAQSDITGHSDDNSRKMADIGEKETEKDVITKTKDKEVWEKALLTQLQMLILRNILILLLVKKFLKLTPYT